MVDGPLTLFESRAIARSIAHKFEGQGIPLYGSTPNDKALVEQWLEVEGQNFQPLVKVILTEKFRKPDMGQQPDEATIRDSLEKVGKVFDVHEAHLAKSKYLAGEFFSLGNLTHMSYINYLIRLCKSSHIFEGRPYVKAWWEDISSHKSWTQVAALAEEDFRANGL